MRVEASTYDESFAAAANREQDLRRMDATIAAHTPDLERYFSQGSGMGGAGIGYGRIDYRTKSAKQPTRSRCWAWCHRSGTSPSMPAWWSTGTTSRSGTPRGWDG